MRASPLHTAAQLALAAKLAKAVDVVYVTDLPIFAELVPCAQNAVSYNVMSQTYSDCPEGVTELQSCACTKNNNFAAISTAISISVSYSCGGVASDDQASAATVFSAYCNQASVASFPPPSITVSQYITDVPGFGDLAPCAASALAYNVESMTYALCPLEAPQLASCVCSKNQNSYLVSGKINSSVKYTCGSTATADISSAQAVFAGYCGLAKGVSSFPVTSDPPGDMTYYITALPQYASLAPCAQNALSYAVQSQTYQACPSGPKALASCACLKGNMPNVVNNILTSSVKYSCSSTASDDITSAQAVFDYYCSAAKGLVTAAGVTESVDQTTATPAETGSGAGTTGPQATGTGSSGGSSSSGGSNGSGSSSGSGSGTGSGGSSSGSSHTGLIAGVVVGVVVGLGLIALAIFFFWRHRRREHQAKLQGTTNQHPTPAAGNVGHGKPELDSAAVAAGTSVSQSPSTLHANAASRVDNVSPVSAGGYGSPVDRSELHGQQVHEAYQPPNNQQQMHETQGQPVQNIHGQRAELQPMGWQAGPVNGYHELEGGGYHPQGGDQAAPQR